MPLFSSGLQLQDSLHLQFSSLFPCCKIHVSTHCQQSYYSFGDHKVRSDANPSISLFSLYSSVSSHLLHFLTFAPEIQIPENLTRKQMLFSLPLVPCFHAS